MRIKRVETKARKNGRPVYRYKLLWEETARDEKNRPIRNDEGRLVKRLRSETFATRELAENREREFSESLAMTGRTPDRAARERTFREWAEEWLTVAETRVRTGKLKASTAEGYRGLLERYVFPEFGERAVGAITPADATGFYRALLSRLAPATAKHGFSVFRRVLDHAAKSGALRDNPATASTWDGSGEGSTAYKFEGHALTVEKVAEVAGHAGDRYPVYGLAVRFLASTGLRAAEFAGLEVGDLRLVARPGGGVKGSVRVVRTRRRKAGEWIEGTPKSKRSTRTVPLPAGLAVELRDYLRDVHPLGDEPTAPLFPGRKAGGYTHGRNRSTRRPGDLDWSSPVEPGTFYKNVLRPAYKAAGLPVTDAREGTRGVRLHDLRHTFATLQLMGGVPIEQVSAWLGHSNSVITSTIYAHWIQSDDETNALDFGAPSPSSASGASGELARGKGTRGSSNDNVVPLRAAR